MSINSNTVTFPCVTVCLLLFLSIVPKAAWNSFGSGTFNIGMIDIVVGIAVTYILLDIHRTSQIKPEMNFIFAYLAVAAFSVIFSVSPLETIRGTIKIVEAVFIFIFAYRYRVSNNKVIAVAIIASLITVAILDRASTDSKVYSSAMLFMSLYFILVAISSNTPGKCNILHQVVSLFFIILGLILIPKKGAVLGILLALVYLYWVGSFRIRRFKTLLIGLILFILAGISLSLFSEGAKAQLDEFTLFASGSQVEEASSMYMRLLLVVSTPTILLNSDYIGFGASTFTGGIGNKLVDILTAISVKFFDFTPTDRILYAGGNSFSDNLYFTLAAETGVLCLVPLWFFGRMVVKRMKDNPVLMAYLILILVFSLSAIDLGIYRGTQIIYLNALLYGMLLQHSLCLTSSDEPKIQVILK